MSGRSLACLLTCPLQALQSLHSIAKEGGGDPKAFKVQMFGLERHRMADGIGFLWLI